MSTDLDDANTFGYCTECGALRRCGYTERDGMTIAVLVCDNGHRDS